MTADVPIRKAALPVWLSLRDALDDVDHIVPCRSAPELWSADALDNEAIQYAETRCQRCPVLTPCAAYADAARERGAVWGGTYRPTKTSKPIGISA